MAAKLPAPAMTAIAMGGRVARQELDGQRAEPAAQEDQRRLGAEDDAEGQGGQGGEEDAGPWEGGVTPPALNPSAGECPPRPGSQRIAGAARRPPTASTGSGHQAGAE